MEENALAGCGLRLLFIQNVIQKELPSVATVNEALFAIFGCLERQFCCVQECDHERHHYTHLAYCLALALRIIDLDDFEPHFAAQFSCIWPVGIT